VSLMWRFTIFPILSSESLTQSNYRRLQDSQPHPRLTNLNGLASRATVDATSEIPEKLPAQRPKQTSVTSVRYDETSVYPYLETNVDASIMEFSQEPIPIERSATSIARHGTDTPFRPWQTIQRYVQSLVDRKGYQDLVSYNTTVELVSKGNGEWEVVLRKSGGGSDYWWKEHFDAVVVANGHYSVPYIPEIKGLQDFERRKPGSVLHTKAYRGRDVYRGKVGSNCFIGLSDFC
jgi:cation diffusion facilitator CzcD-associated flavoprotein CzcO